MAKKRTAPPPVSRDEDISGPLPPDLIAAWRESSRSVNRAWELMKPALVEATVLAGDGSRLTALSHKLDPTELAARVDLTQRVIHGLAVAAGGRAPGAAWSADNFQVIFPPHAPVEFVIGLALEMHKRCAADERLLTVCIAIHRGHFYELGGGLYGEDANTVEFLAEESAEAGETLITKAVIDSLRPSTRLATVRRSDLDHVGTEVHRVQPGAKMPAPLSMMRPGGDTFPLPYSRRFHEGLTGIDDAEAWPARRDAVNETYGAERTVIMAEVSVPVGTRPYDILENSIRDAQLALSLGRLLSDGAELIENLGSFILVSYQDPQAALDFAAALARHFFAHDLQCQLGLDRGHVLLVPPDEADEPWNVLGRPVYMAAKLSHELGRSNSLMISDRALAGLPAPEGAKPFSDTVSGVLCSGVQLEISAP